MTRSNVDYLRELSSLSGSPSIIECLRDISGKPVGSTQTEYLAEITGESLGKERIWYYKVWSGLFGNVSINDCLKKKSNDNEFLPENSIVEGVFAIEQNGIQIVENGVRIGYA